MNKDIVRQWVNVAALVFTLAVNGLSEAIPLNGQTSAEIANRLPILFVPANYVFGIWGIIYMLLLAFGIYQALPSQKQNPLLRRIGYWFALTCLANGTWLVLFHYNLFALSMVAMVILLVALIVIYTRVGVGQQKVSTAEHWCIHIPFSTYLGWITVATIANAAYVLFDAGWDGFGIAPEVWTVSLLIVAAILTLTIIMQRRDVAYTAVLVWALVGIYVKQSPTPVVAYSALAVAVIVAVALIARLITGRQTNSGTMQPA
jgi:TspO/MBR family